MSTKNDLWCLNNTRKQNDASLSHLEFDTNDRIQAFIIVFFRKKTKTENHSEMEYYFHPVWRMR